MGWTRDYYWSDDIWLVGKEAIGLEERIYLRTVTGCAKRNSILRLEVNIWLPVGKLG